MECFNNTIFYWAIRFLKNITIYYNKVNNKGGFPMLKMLLLLLIIIVYFCAVKFCKSATTDIQELEDELFIKTYVCGKDIDDSI